MRRACRRLYALPLVCLVLAAWTSPAHATGDDYGGGVAGGAGSVSVSGPVVSVAVSGSVELLEGASGPGASSVGVQAAPVCWWEPGRTGAQTAADIQSGYYDVDLPQAEELRGVLASLYPGWKEHREDTTGRWWAPACDPGRWEGDAEGYRRHAQAFGERGPRRFLPEGQSPPPPTLTPAELATAVRRSLRVPAPQVGTNPAVGPRGATVVGMDTWVWATGTTLRQAQVTAAAATTSVTVSITATGLRLQAPDSRSSCTGWGRPWEPGAPEGASDCTIRFTRSSAHLGGTTPLRVSATYDITWTASDGTSGTLAPLTTTTTLDLPVAEIQTINTPPTKKP